MLLSACASDSTSSVGSDDSSEPGMYPSTAPSEGVGFASEQLSDIVRRSASRTFIENGVAPPEALWRSRLTQASEEQRLRSLDPFGAGPSSTLTGPSPDPVRTFQATGTEGTPPDTMGAVGPNHVLTAINFVVQIQNRTGTVLSKVFLNDFFASVIPVTNGAFDPRAAYDPLSNRWIVAATSTPQETAADLIAVSQSSDPTGAWHFYSIPTDPGQHWTDQPRLGFNTKWIVYQRNLFPVFGTAADFREDLLVFDKAALYAGNPAAPRTVLTVPTGNVPSPAQTYDAGEQNLYTFEAESNDAGGFSLVHLRRVTGPVGSEVLEDLGSITAPVTWGGNVNGPQRGTTNRLAFGGFTMENVVVRNGMVYGVHGIGLPAAAPTHDAVQWWQVDPRTLNVVQVARVDDPAGVFSVGRPSIAVNRNSDVLVGYTRTSVNQFASTNYAVHAGHDAPGTMRSDTLYKPGEAPYEIDRWGDYSNSVVDPVDGVSMWTIQQYAAAPSSNYGLWWAQVPPPNTAYNLVFSDDFNDGNDTGWTRVAGNWFIISVPGGGFAYQQVDNNGTKLSVAGSSNTDVVVEARVKPTSFNGSAMAGILGRYTSATAAYRLAVSQNNRLQLIKHTTTGPVVLASQPISSAATLPTNIAYTLRLELRGTSLKGYVDNRLLVSATDATYASGSAGVLTVNATSEFDDVSVRTITPELFRAEFQNGSSGWTLQGGTWAIGTDGNAVFTESATSGTTRAVAGSTWTDQSVEARVKPIAFGAAGRNVHVFARFQDANNNYRLALRDTNQLELRRTVGGTSTVLVLQPLSTAATLQTGIWYNLRLQASGTSLKAYVNGALIASTTDSSVPNGRVAIGTVNTSATFDDIVVRPR
jgi:hypothetical protein